MMDKKEPRDCVNNPGRDRKASSDMTDSTQQARAASIPDAAIEAAATLFARLAPIGALGHGFARAVNYETQMEDTLAKARVLSVTEERVREFVAAEQGRAASSPRPFSWDAVSEQIARAALANNLEHLRKFRDWKVGDPVE